MDELPHRGLQRADKGALANESHTQTHMFSCAHDFDDWKRSSVCATLHSIAFQRDTRIIDNDDPIYKSSRAEGSSSSNSYVINGLLQAR